MLNLLLIAQDVLSEHFARRDNTKALQSYLLCTGGNGKKIILVDGGDQALITR
jgi:hypothetical protein